MNTNSCLYNFGREYCFRYGIRLKNLLYFHYAPFVNPIVFVFCVLVHSCFSMAVSIVKTDVSKPKVYEINVFKDPSRDPFSVCYLHFGENTTFKTIGQADCMEDYIVFMILLTYMKKNI